jgi:hypothetical protein
MCYAADVADIDGPYSYAGGAQAPVSAYTFYPRYRVGIDVNSATAEVRF